jgi:hypothetical protein
MKLADLNDSQARGNLALKQLRKARLAKGLPFMINSKDLPGKQCYLEFSDGRIVLVGINAGTDRDFTVIRELSTTEKAFVRKKFQLS